MKLLKNLIFSKFPEPLIGFLRRFKYWLIRLISIPMHLGGDDYYPNVTYLLPFKYFSRSFSFDPETRIKYWTTIARSYPAFSHFYSDDPGKSFASSSEFKKIHPYGDLIVDLYSEGVAKVENFLNKDEHDAILSLIEKEIVSMHPEKSRRAQNPIRARDVNLKTVQIFEKTIYGKKLRERNYNMNSLLIVDNFSPYETSVLWHQDRFLPCIKFLYFPTEVSTNPFEYMKGSQKIDRQYFENAILTASKTCEDINDNYNYQGYERESFYVKGNTLLLAATHGLHRRLREHKSGVRNDIIMSHEFTFTRYDLCWNYIKTSLL